MNADDGRRALVLAPEVAREVLDHALEVAPDECCGILLGPEKSRATRVLRAENVHEDVRTRYQIDPETMLRAVELEDAGQARVVGFYHSHPRGAAAFSEEDRARGAWEGLDYLLVCLSPLTFLAGRWDGEGFEDLHVLVPEESG